MSNQAQITSRLREALGKSRHVFVLTGAGVSAESGVPTFRGGGKEIVWKGMPFSQISSAKMVRDDLPGVWEWFDYRREALKEAKPNPAHLTLARWAKRFSQLTLVTQNIDDLHRAAGSRDVLELHGNIWRTRCLKCSASGDLRDGDDKRRPPQCQKCGGLMRPDVILFGELLPEDVLETAFARAETCDLCFVVGTSGVVYPAAALPEVARRAGAFTVEVNPERTPLSSICDEFLCGRAGEILPLI